MDTDRSQVKTCQACGNEAQQDATFCHNCGSALQDSSPNQTEPLEAAPSSEPALTNPEFSTKFSTGYRNLWVIGTVIEFIDATMRVLPSGSVAKLVEVVIPMRGAIRVANLVQAGDEIEVIGDVREDGTLRPWRIVNLKTEVVVFGRSVIRGYRCGGIVTALSGHTAQILVQNSNFISAPLVFRSSSRAFDRFSQLVHEGDEIDVTGTLDRSSLEPSRIKMSTTGTLVYGRSRLAWVTAAVSAAVYFCLILVVLNSNVRDRETALLWLVIFTVILAAGISWRVIRAKSATK